MNILLYILTTAIWGSTWLAIQYQLGIVPPVWSVAYRFALASLLLIAYCLISKQSLQFSWRQHRLIALQGFCLFSANYCLYYLGSAYFISGIVAVIFASIMLFNIINMRIIFGKPIALRVLLGAGIGMLGLITIMATEILHLPKTNISHTLTGLGICLLATLLASWGNILSAYHQQQGLAILPTNTLGMLYGTVFLLSFALLLHQPPQFSWQASYIYSLLYLTLFGTVLAFGVYLKLLGRIGAERAAYTFIVIPLIAMLLSTVFEDFHWHFHTFVGTFLILWGNYLVLIKNRARLSSQEK